MLVRKDNKVVITEHFATDKAQYHYGFDRNREYPISVLAQVKDFIEYKKVMVMVNYGHYAVSSNYRKFLNNQKLCAIPH
jgi:hypothetical protein